MKQQVEGSIRHLRNTPVSSDGEGGFDTIGLLLDQVKCEHLTYTADMFQNAEVRKAHDKCMLKVYKQYEIPANEWMDILNDNAKMDWLSIAMKYCPSEKVNGETEEQKG